MLFVCLLDSLVALRCNVFCSVSGASLAAILIPILLRCYLVTAFCNVVILPIPKPVHPTVIKCLYNLHGMVFCNRFIAWDKTKINQKKKSPNRKPNQQNKSYSPFFIAIHCSYPSAWLQWLGMLSSFVSHQYLNQNLLHKLPHQSVLPMCVVVGWCREEQLVLIQTQTS